ncbi:hypothetical protein JTB14_021372 [Gonioctena quinquepunctata]|nr:hypothetical protein JTB14_021372 [Gonioctena quinquepunctata]
MKKYIIILFLVVCSVKCEMDFEFGVGEMKKICPLDLENVEVSKECAEQLNESCRNGTVLFNLFDASSKFPYSGVSAASRSDYGNFDQCLSIDHEYNGGRIFGKFCYPGLILADFNNISNTDSDSLYKLSTCIPEACVASDYNSIFSTLLNGNFPGSFFDFMCASKNDEREYGPLFIITMLIICGCVTAMVVSTTYDVYLHQKQLKSHHPLLLAFSVYSNGLKILETSNGNKEQIQVFHGLKTISMLWVICGHGFVGWRTLPVDNYQNVIDVQKSLYIFYATSAPLAVDTFFFISGFLLAYQYLKMKARPLMVHITSIPQLIIHRYLRLTPAVLMLYLVTVSILPHLGSGPLWNSAIDTVVNRCYDDWWPFFLYIQNYYTYPVEPCLVHTWYLSADMQMFLLSPLVMIPVAILLKDTSRLKMCMFCLLILNIFLTALPMALKLTVQDYTNNYDTHSRLINYFIGIMLGTFMRVRLDKPFLYNKVKRLSLVNLMIWVVVLLGMLATTICYQEVERNHGYESKQVFYSLMRPAWCIGLSWIVYSSCHGYGGIVSWFLSRPIFQVLGRLSYCIYIVHGLVVVHRILTNRTRLHSSDYDEFYLWCGYTVISVSMAFVWTLAFESPLMIIEKQLMARGRQRTEVKPTTAPQEKRTNVE